LVKKNGAKKRLKLMLHDWKRRGKRCSSLQFLKQGKDVLRNEGIINHWKKFWKSIEGHRMEIVWTFIGNRVDFGYR
jgi:hypothetical protein